MSILSVNRNSATLTPNALSSAMWYVSQEIVWYLAHRSVEFETWAGIELCEFQAGARAKLRSKYKKKNPSQYPAHINKEF